MIDLIDVRLFMMAAHDKQFRADDITPYHTHPQEVLDRAIEWYADTDPDIVNDPEFHALCLLHDVDEDCREKGFTLGLIGHKYGMDVMGYCYYVTKPRKPSDILALSGEAYRKAKLEFNREHYRQLFRYGPRHCHLAKFADRGTNLMQLHAPGISDSFRATQLADTLNLLEEAHGTRGLDRVFEIYELVRDGRL